MVDVVKEYYKNLSDQNSATAEVINSVLDIVKQFIIDRRRIIVGGMMIDMSLKLKGDEIYGPNVLPDYDFYSPNHFRDAYDLGEILCHAGYKQISVIPAQHVTTMKVRVDFEVVADITYCPQNIYDNIPTLMYDKFIIRHPHVQMIDQHLALSNPFTNPGREVIFDRWKKDCDRYDMLYKYYPIESTTDDIIIPSRMPNKDILKNNCLGGLDAFYYWVKKFNSLSSNPIPYKTGDVDHPITILTQDIETYANDCKDKCYSQYFDHIPRRAYVNGSVSYEYLDTYGQKISAYNDPDFGWVCNLQYVMVYLLSKMIYKVDIQTPILKNYYNWCRYMITESYKCDNALLFLPTATVYGDHMESGSADIYVKRFMNRLEKKPNIDYTPKSAYPKYPSCMIKADFDVTKSPYFDINGMEIKHLKHTEPSII